MPTPYGEQVMAAADTPVPMLVDRPIPGGYNAPLPEGFTIGGGVKQDFYSPKYPPQEYGSFYTPATGQSVEAAYAKMRADMAVWLAQDPEIEEEAKTAYANGRDTVENMMIEEIQKRYNERYIDRGVLENIYEYPEEERLERVTSELARFDANKETNEMLAAAELMRAGYGQLPREAVTEFLLKSRPQEIEALMNQWKQGRIKEIQDELDKIAAVAGENFSTLEALGQMVYQDMIPFLGQATRVIGVQDFLPEEINIGALDQLLPGEMRQEIREWYVNATHEERLEYVKGLQDVVNSMRKGPNASLYTEYLVIENLFEIFTEDLLQNDDPKNTADRIIENVVSTLGTVVGIGLIANRAKSVTRMARSSRASGLTHSASAVGRRDIAENIENNIESVAAEYGMKTGEPAFVHLPRPREDGSLDAMPDSVKEAHEVAKRQGDEVLGRTNNLTGLHLTNEQRVDVVREEVARLSDADNVHANHKMSTIQDLDDGSGIRVTMNYGKQPGKGWNDLGELMDTIKDLSIEDLSKIRIMRRNRYGHMEPMDITPSEIRDYILDGRIPVELEQRLDPSNATSRLFGGRKLDSVGQQELEDVLRVTDPASTDYVNIRTELNRRSGMDIPEDAYKFLNGEEFYIERTQDRYWAVTDAKGFEGGWAHTWVPTFLRFLLAPNSKFGTIYQQTRQAYHTESAAMTTMNNIYRPFHQLSTKSQQKVQNVLLWGENQAKADYEKFGKGYAPTLEEIVAEFPDLTEAELRGIVAVREGLDIQYQLFNRRLYREFQSQGKVTIREAFGAGAPNYHGNRIENPTPGKYWNPMTREVEELSRKDVDDIIAEGGGFLDLGDIPVDVPSGGQFTRIVARKGQYEFGPLSSTPLNYYEGYTMRLYQDPVVITKVTRNPMMNGERMLTKEGEKPPVREEVIRTAGSVPEARRFLDRFRTRPKDKYGYIDPDDPNVTYRIDYGRNLNTTEGTLAQAEALYREGRMFWDRRAMERLPDVNSNPAQVWDLAHTLHKGTQMAIRQTTQEDLFRAFKDMFTKEFKDLPGIGEVTFKLDDLAKIKKRLREARRAATDPDLKKEYTRAIEMVNYMRSQLGTDAFLVPEIRTAMVAFANWFGSYGGKVTDPIARFATRVGLSADPFAFMRRTAFYSFMTLRPVRQLLLQSMQITMLTGLDPKYIGTGKIFTDAIALRRGVNQFNRSGYSDGWADAKVGRMMGLSKKEYKRLVEEFDRTGMLGTVDTHAFNAAGASSTYAKMPSDAGAIGRGVYNVRRRGRQVVNFLQNGFEYGEQNNLTFSWLLAVRRHMKDKGYTNVMSMSRQDWDEVVNQADSLALAMTRPNKMAYQQGVAGMALQFLSFQHRALLTLLGQNPAIKRGELWKLYAGMYGLWGFNTFGAEDWVRDTLLQPLGIDGTREVYAGATLQDILASGLVETGYNMLARANGGTELELSTFAPGTSIYNNYYNLYEALAEKSIYHTLLGPSRTVVDTFSAGIEFMEGMGRSERLSPEEKLIGLADHLAQGGLAALNDQMSTWRSYQLGQFVDKAGDPLPIQSTVDGLVARSLLGIRPESEAALYELKREIWENEENIQNVVSAIRKELKILALQDRERKYPREQIIKQVSIIWAMLEDAPDHAKQEIYTRVFKDPDNEGQTLTQILAETAQEGTMDLRELIPWISQQSDWSAEQKDTMIMWINEVMDQREQTGASFEEMTREDINTWLN